MTRRGDSPPPIDRQGNERSPPCLSGATCGRCGDRRRVRGTFSRRTSRRSAVFLQQQQQAPNTWSPGVAPLGATSIKEYPGGVRFHGTLETGLKACLWSRVAMRILEPLSKFPAPDADALYEGVRAIDWPAYLNANTTFAVDATGMSDTLRHTHFTALRVKDAIVDSLRDATGTRPSIDARNPDVLVVAHIGRGRCEISLDFAGQPLFKRGYRVAPALASLKETLAAAVLLSSGYDGETPLVDPMCGAGTIAIEAALIAANRAPGLGRSFGIERWPSFDANGRALLRRLQEEAKAAERLESSPDSRDGS